MTLEELQRLPERPESEVEWEDLLLRLELMPKALRVELEHPGSWERRERLFTELRERELDVADFLERAARGSAGAERSRSFRTDSPSSFRAEPSGVEESAPPPRADAGPASRVEQFVRIRSRNFAMVQRRGIEVWDWGAVLSRETRASVFQVLSRLARGDVDVLARLRATRHAPQRSPVGAPGAPPGPSTTACQC